MKKTKKKRIENLAVKPNIKEDTSEIKRMENKSETTQSQCQNKLGIEIKQRGNQANPEVKGNKCIYR